MLAKGGAATVTNFKETIKSSLKNRFVKSFPPTFKGLIDALVARMGETPAKYLDNLVASGLTNQVLKDLIKEALAFPPDPAQINGFWKGSYIITKVEIPESEKKKAEEAGCEQAIRKIEGKKQALVIELKVNNSGVGTAKISLGKGGGTGSANYSDGIIKMVLSAEGSTITFNGKVVFKKDGGVLMTSTWRTPYQNSKIILSGTFSAVK